MYKETQPQAKDDSSIVADLLNRIAKQAEEIGALKERIRTLEEEKEKRADDAHYTPAANVG